MDDKGIIRSKFAKLLTESGILDGFPEKAETVVKIHFGEEGNTGFVKPEYVRTLSDILRSAGAKITVSDTNTLYKGKRSNSEDHLKIAHAHGFTPEKTNAEIVIPDDSLEENVSRIKMRHIHVLSFDQIRTFLKHLQIF